jgi:hypothetical protein
MNVFPKKDPTEEVYASFNFASSLIPGETISAATWTITVDRGTDQAPQTMLSGPVDISSAPVITQKIIGGTAGTRYLVRCLATTQTRKIIGAAFLPVELGGASV